MTLDHPAPASSRPSADGSASRRCRFCARPLVTSFLDLGMSPPCQSRILAADLDRMERFYPLHAYVCDGCKLVQLQDFVAPEEIFSEYAYFSSYSSSWLAHARQYVDMACRRFGLGTGSRVMEVASNDGYLLQYFLPRGPRILGIEPAANVAEAAVARGVPTTVCFLGRETARDIVATNGRADLLIGNNVLAHVPDINDFVGGLALLLAPRGSITMEFPHLMRLVEGNQFDTVYHEHFSYFSLLVVERIFAAHGLVVYDVEELPTHGGSLRIFACHADQAGSPGLAISRAVQALRQREIDDGFDGLARYAGFGERVKALKRQLLSLLIDARNQGRTVVGYGAPGKGNTLLNYCGIRSDLLDFTTDANPYKQGSYTPGTHIPIVAPERIREHRPDFVLILPWNLQTEIREEAAYIREWGGRFIIPMPEPRIVAA